MRFFYFFSLFVCCFGITFFLVSAPAKLNRSDIDKVCRICENTCAKRVTPFFKKLIGVDLKKSCQMNCSKNAEIAMRFFEIVKAKKISIDHVFNQLKEKKIRPSQWLTDEEILQVAGMISPVDKEKDINWKEILKNGDARDVNALRDKYRQMHATIFQAEEIVDERITLFFLFNEELRMIAEEYRLRDKFEQ